MTMTGAVPANHHRVPRLVWDPPLLVDPTRYVSVALSFSVRVPPSYPRTFCFLDFPRPINSPKRVQSARYKSLKLAKDGNPFSTPQNPPARIRRYRTLRRTRKLWPQSSRCTWLITSPRCSSPPLALRSFTTLSRLNLRASSSGRRVGMRWVRATASVGAFLSFYFCLWHADRKGGVTGGVFLVEH